MDKQAVKEIAIRHGLIDSPQNNTQPAAVYGYTDEILSRVRQGQKQRHEFLAYDLQRVINMIDNDSGEKDIKKSVETLRDLIAGLTSPAYHTDIELVGIPSVHSVPYYPLDGEEQVTVVGKVGENNDPINPNHYKTASGVQAIDIAELFPYSLGNAIKYAWRAGKKDNIKQDLEKCEWYLNRAMANGEIIFLKPFTQVTHKAWYRFKKVQDELPVRNAEVLSNILQGNLQVALNLLDSWITELD